MAKPEWAGDIVTIAKSHMWDVQTLIDLIWMALPLPQLGQHPQILRQIFFSNIDVAMYTSAVDRFREA